MNSCLQCGKEIPEGKKFCNSSCSAKYNNSRRVRKPWTEEQKKRVRKCTESVQIFCKYCGQEIAKGTVCPSCKDYFKVSLYKKLGLLEGPLQERFYKAVSIVSGYYFQDKKSIPEIKEKTGLHFGTIRYLLLQGGRHGLRTKSEALQNAIESGRRDLNAGQNQYKVGVHTSWEGNKYAFRSSWEEEYMQELDSKKISYLYEPFKVRYFDSQKGTERLAIPDFFFPETNTIVELKSSWTYDEQNMKDRVKSYKEKGYKVILLLDWKEINL